MVRLSQATEQRDVLDVLAANRREIRFSLQSDHPLRKGGNRYQRKRMRCLREKLARDIRAQMSFETRRVFRGSIAVEMRLALPERRDAAALAPVVKDYLDLLSNSVVRDDKFVDHLIVLREPPVDEKTTVRVTCLPSPIFAADFDRAFRVLPQGAAAALIKHPEPEPDRFIRPAEAIWGLSPFDETSRELLSWDENTLAIIEDIDAQEAEQLAEDPDAGLNLDFPSQYAEFADREVRDSARRHLETSTASARGRWLTDQGFDVRDRPGLSPAWIAEAVQLDTADVLALPDEGPGCFLLPAPPTRQTALNAERWEHQVQNLFQARRAGGWHSVSFGGPLALDVALRGGAGGHADVDNITNKILAAFLLAFRHSEPVMAGYRAYRMNARVAGIRVRIMPAVRLEALTRATQHARTVLRDERSERRRD